MSGVALSLRDVVVRFGPLEAVRGVSAEVAPGERLAIVGRNAAGKSTLLRVMGGLLTPNAGEVRLDGRPISSLAVSARARRIAFVAQRPQLAAAFTLREMVALGRFARPPAPARIEEAIADVGLAAEAERPFHALSIGQQQRAALARALAQVDPDSILLLDEPFASMDYGEAHRALGLLLRHAAGGGVVVAVLHDLALAAALAKRVWLLEGGRLARAGDADAVLTRTDLEARFGITFDALADGTPVPAWRRGREPPAPA